VLTKKDDSMHLGFWKNGKRHGLGYQSTRWELGTNQVLAMFKGDMLTGKGK